MGTMLRFPVTVFVVMIRLLRLHPQPNLLEAGTYSVFAAGASYVKECQKRGVLPSGVGLSLTDMDESFVELEINVVGIVGTGAHWFLTGWAEGTEVEFMIDTGCQVTILTTSVYE